jgi:hypothetical protein
MNAIPMEGSIRVGKIAWIESVVLALAVCAWAYFSYGYVEDDAFIHLEYARSFSSGLGFAFAGHVSNGDTSPLWVLFVSFIQLFAGDWIVAAKIACAAGLVITASGAWRLASDLPHETATHALLPLAAVAVTLINPYFVHWSFSGMEATAALGLSFWAIWAVFANRAWLAASLIAIGPVLRPELLVFAALLGPALLWRQWQARRRELVIALAVVMAIPVAVWFVYALHAFGTVVPNTNAAKRGGALPEIASRLVQVYLMGFSVTLLLLPFVCAWSLRSRKTPTVVWALLLWPAACIVFYLANHTLVQTRYCLLSMPSLTLAVLWLLGRVSRPRLFTTSTAGMLVASSVVVVLIVIPHVRNKEELRDVTSMVSTYVRDHVPADAPVAVMAIGQVEFESRHALVDLGGITHPEVVRYLNNPAGTLQWAKGQGARYFVGRQPEASAERVFGSELPYVGWSLQHAKYREKEEYGVYRLR